MLMCLNQKETADGLAGPSPHSVNFTYAHFFLQYIISDTHLNKVEDLPAAIERASGAGVVDIVEMGMHVASNRRTLKIVESRLTKWRA
jgi:hypothetical protein